MRHGPATARPNAPGGHGLGDRLGRLRRRRRLGPVRRELPRSARHDREPDPSGTDRTGCSATTVGSFTDVTEAAGVGDPDGFGMGATFADYDDDGDVDLYVTNLGPNRLFRNRGDGTFEDVAAEEAGGCGRPVVGGSGLGRLTTGTATWTSTSATTCATTPPLPGPSWSWTRPAGAYTIPFTLNPNSFDPEPNRLYRNRGDGTFEDVAEVLRRGRPERPQPRRHPLRPGRRRVARPLHQQRRLHQQAVSEHGRPDLRRRGAGRSSSPISRR